MANRDSMIVQELSFEFDGSFPNDSVREMFEDLQKTVEQWNLILFPHLIGPGNPFPNMRLVARGIRPELPEVMSADLRKAVGFDTDSEDESGVDNGRKRKADEQLEEEPASKVARSDSSSPQELEKDA